MIRDFTAGDHHIYHNNEKLPLKKGASFVGRGSQGFVFAARHRFTDKEYAIREMRTGIKLPSRVRYTSKVFNDHFVKMLATYEHKGITVAVLEPLAQGNLAYFCRCPNHFMEHVALKERLSKIICWMHSLAEGLRFMYRVGVVHGNIKPETYL